MDIFSNLPYITLQSPGAILFSIGKLQIHWYGVIIAIAFLAGLKIALHIAKQEEINPDRIINLSAGLLIGGIFFARLYFVVFNWHYFSSHFTEIFMLWKGGLSIHGVIIGCFFILLFYTKFKKLPLLKYIDIFACALPLGQCIGRWGNFFNSEAFGIPTNWFLRVYIPPEFRPEGYLQYKYFHPTFLYESIWDLVIFFVLFFVIRRKFRDTNGVITLSYLILYSLGRFFIEAIRTDNIYSVFGLHIAQFVSLILIIMAFLSLLFVFLNKKYSHSNYTAHKK